MSLKSEISPYIQQDGLVSVYSNSNNVFRNVDNGVLFTSIYYILLKRLGQLESSDVQEYQKLIQSCCAYPDNYLHRAPQDDSQDAQDDFNGAYSAHIQLGIKPSFVMSPSVYQYISLWAMRAMASQNIFWRILSTPLVFLTAIIIATSCINDPISDTDGRIGSWLVGSAMQSSWMCKLAIIIWVREGDNIEYLDNSIIKENNRKKEKI